MSGEKFTLYTYFRSSAAWRVRIALNLKGLAAEPAYIHLLKDGGQQNAEAYRAVNPQGLVPALVHGDRTITQSLAIIEYLDEIAPEPPLLPKAPPARARVRQIALAVACDIHPLNNLRVLNYLRDVHGLSDEERGRWYRHWVALGFAALETGLAGAKETGKFCHGDAPTLADICLVPQMANARRFSVDLAPYPTLVRIDEAARALDAFARAAPEAQADAA